jgi:hypothetical protein
VKHIRNFLTAGLFLLPACKPKNTSESPQAASPEGSTPVPTASKPAGPPKIFATDTGKSGPGAQTIKSGDVTMSFTADGKPLSFTRGKGANLINTANPGPGFYMTIGSGPDEITIPFTSFESRDGKLILTAADNTRATLAVNARDRHISFQLEALENVPAGSKPILRFQATFNNICPAVVPFDYMISTGDFYAARRVTMNVAWSFFWDRNENDPLGGFAFFVPLNEEDHNESLLRIWTEEEVPHPKVDGKWTYERAKAWVEEWKSKFTDTHTLSLSAEKPEDLDVLIDYAKKLHVNRLYLHTDTWRGAYWVYDRDPLSVNKKVFPRGEADLKAFQDKLKANGMDAMIHTLCYGFGQEGSKYIGKGKKTDRRLANWGKGKLEKSISATDTTIFFRPNPGVVFPSSDTSLPWPKSYPRFFSIGDILIGDEIVPCKFENTDQEVWTLKVNQRGAIPANHEAGTEIIGLLKAYNQNYYPDSRTDLCEITAKEYADFFNRMGIQHNEFDGGECHQDVPWGFAKWTMFVYQNTRHPMTSNTSGGRPNQWDMVYMFKSNGDYILYKRGGGYAGMTLHREGRPATSPIENHFNLAAGAAGNSTGFMIKKPEPMFGLFPKTIKEYGLSDLVADQFSTWRELAPKLDPELRKRISESYYSDMTPFPLDPGPRIAKTIFEARRVEGGYEIQPFYIMSRGEEDSEWRTVQEYGAIAPRQYVGTGMRLNLENPFARQAPQFIIRVLNGYTDGFVERKTEASKEELSKDMQGYNIGAGVNPQHVAPAPAAAVVENAAALVIQPKAAQINNPGKHGFADAGAALEVSLDNLDKAAPAAQPASAPKEHFQPEGLPSFAFKGNAQNARGVALTVTGDGSGAYLVIQVGPNKDYVVILNFTGRKDIFIPIGEVARTTGRWGMRYHTKGAGYGAFNTVSIGFGRVLANTYPKALVENLRIVGEKPSSIKNPVIHAGAGTLKVKGEVKSDQYLWYQGGDSVGVYDLNWCLLEKLPVEIRNYAVDKGFSEFWIDGQSGNPPPWLDVQFITKGETMEIKN